MEKTHNRRGFHFAVCGKMCIFGGFVGIFNKIAKMSKKSQIAVDGIAFAYYNLCVLERETRTEKCP